MACDCHLYSHFVWTAGSVLVSLIKFRSGKLMFVLQITIILYQLQLELQFHYDSFD
jgi:hypothetical protein